MIRPGVTTGEVVEVWPKAEEFGFPDEEAAFALQFGHGVGLAIWEKPIFSRLVSLDHPEEIQEGMVFALETFWPSSDGWSAARIEEQLVVTADGCEVITRFPAEDLVIAGKPYYTVGGTLPLERDHQSNRNTRLDADAREAVPGNGRMPAGDPVRLYACAPRSSRRWDARRRPPSCPSPHARPGEALVRIRAAALNPVELHIWNGHFFDGPPRPPYVIGLEGVGVVEEGERLAPGTRVRVEFVHPGYGRDGAVAEYARRARGARRLGARLAGVGGSDRRRARRRRPPRSACRCSPRSCASSARRPRARRSTVRTCWYRRDRRRGARRGPARQADGRGARGGGGRDLERLERALSLGADATVELGDGVGAEELRDRFAEAADGRLDVALDPLWGEPARAAIDALTRDGVYVSFGQAASPVAELSGIPLRNRRVTVVGHSGAWATPQERQAALARAHELAERSGAGSTLDTEEVALDEIGDAWERLSSSAGPQAGGQAVTTSTETLPYPRFSDAEMARRREALAAELEAAGAAHAVLYGANRAGPAVGWLTRWPVTREALCVFTPGERDLLLVNFYNHLPNARGSQPRPTCAGRGRSRWPRRIEELERRGARGRARRA